MSKPVELTINGDASSPLAKQIVESVKLHQRLLGLEDWYGHLNFAKVETKDGGEGMETECWPQYKKFEITADVEAFRNSPEYIHHYVRHECMHILLWNYFGFAQDMCYKNAQKALTKNEEGAIYLLEHMPLWDLVYGKSEVV